MTETKDGVRTASTTLLLEPYPATRVFQHGYTKTPDWIVANTTQVVLEYNARTVTVQSTWSHQLQVEIVMEWWEPAPAWSWGRVVYREPKNWERWDSNQLWGLYEAATDHCKELNAYLRKHFKTEYAGTDELLAVEAAYDALLLPRREGNWDAVYRYVETIQTIIMDTVEPRVVNEIRNRLVEKFQKERWGDCFGP